MTNSVNTSNTSDINLTQAALEAAEKAYKEALKAHSEAQAKGAENALEEINKLRIKFSISDSALLKKTGMYSRYTVSKKVKNKDSESVGKQEDAAEVNAA